VRDARKSNIRFPEDIGIIEYDLIAEIGLQPSEFEDWSIQKVLWYWQMHQEKKRQEAEAMKKGAKT